MAAHLQSTLGRARLRCVRACADTSVAYSMPDLFLLRALICSGLEILTYVTPAAWGGHVT